jgi:SAM-dependent methyltransferase
MKRRYDEDKDIWDSCAEIYEEKIVRGHPDIAMMEDFEESLLDAILRCVAEKTSRPIKLFDLGCGSGRLHIRYGAKTTSIKELPDDHPVSQLKEHKPELEYDPVLEQRLGEIEGVDFSQKMINLAEAKVDEYCINDTSSVEFTLTRGSAFEVEHNGREYLPVAVCLINSIGVMQDEAGAARLFEAMRNVVEDAGGVALISCYRKSYLPYYGLGQYESTLTVSGQPVWLVPDTYAGDKYVLEARRYKRAYSGDNTVVADVYSEDGDKIEEGFILCRDPEAVAETVRDGRIRTHSGYNSRWYSFNRMNEWIEGFWAGDRYHIESKELDVIRAEPGQLAIMDCERNLGKLFERWGATPAFN